MRKQDFSSQNAGSLERESELLPSDPPARTARVLATFLLALFLAVALFVTFVPLPATVRGRFVLQPEGGADPVNAVHAGTLQSVSAKVGSLVREGEVLFQIRSPELRELAAERSKLSLDLVRATQQLESHLRGPESGPAAGARPSLLRARIKRLEREQEAEALLDIELARQYEVQLEMVQSDARILLQEVAARRDRVENLRELLDQVKQLRDQKVGAKQQVLRNQEELAEGRAELEEILRDHVKAKQEMGNLEAGRMVTIMEREVAATHHQGELEEARAALEEKLLELETFVNAGTRRMAFLDSALTSVDGDLLKVKAPFDGTIVSLAVQRAGLAVERGQKLCEVSRANALLYAAIDIPESQAGRVDRGQTVRLLLDAYPYTRHGVRPARLVWVSPAAANGLLPGIAVLEDPTVTVKGESRPLSAGMAGDVRIYTGSRTLLEYVFEPLQQFRESFRASGDR